MTKDLPKNVFPFIRHFLKNYKPAVFVSMLLALAAGFWGPFNSLLMKYLINLLGEVKHGDISPLMLPTCLIVLNFLILDNITWRGITYIRAKYVPLVINNIIKESFESVLSKSHLFFQETLSGRLSKHISHLADGVEKLITSVAHNFLRGTSLLLAAFVSAFFVNPIFCLILVVWFVFFLSASVWMSQKLVSLSDRQAQRESVVMGELVDGLSNQSNIRTFSKKSYELTRMIPFLDAQQKAYSKTYRYALVMHSVQGGSIAIMMSFSCYFLVSLYGKNLITIGDFALILGISMESGHMMWYTMSELDEFNKAVGRCKQSLSSIMLPLEIKDQEHALPLKCDQGNISFKNVHFHYKDSHPLFHQLSIDIIGGQKVGLVGYSGSGKSTFVNLILRLYDVTKGSILMDGQDIKNITQDSLRENIAMIPQDPSLFHRSLMDNIRYGRIDATDEEVIEASQKAHAHEFIIKLPEKYDSLVGERGIKLSGGQRQRIAIARAILKNAPILILDEATSQLDSVTETLIQDSLWNIMENKTTLVIAHRLSTLLHMDRILVFDEGKILEDGTHDDLLQKNGLYKELWDAQVGGFLGDDPKPKNPFFIS